MAGELAYAIGAERLIFLTDVNGVMDGVGQSHPTPQCEERPPSPRFRCGEGRNDTQAGGLFACPGPGSGD